MSPTELDALGKEIGRTLAEEVRGLIERRLDQRDALLRDFVRQAIKEALAAAPPAEVVELSARRQK